MVSVSVFQLQQAVLHLLDDYCRDYLIFKPKYYFIAHKYILKITTHESDEQSKKAILFAVFQLYKKLILLKSEKLATRVGLLLARYLHINEQEYLHYREAKIWTQHYFQGYGPFESRVYEDNNKQQFVNVTDPIYKRFTRLKNQIELSKVVPFDFHPHYAETVFP